LAGYLVARPFAGAADPGLDDVRFYVNFALRRAGRPNSRQRTSASPRGELTRSASFDPGRPTAITGGARGYEFQVVAPSIWSLAARAAAVCCCWRMTRAAEASVARDRWSWATASEIPRAVRSSSLYVSSTSS
jgi:hypothetical protein